MCVWLAADHSAAWRGETEPAEPECEAEGPGESVIEPENKLDAISLKWVGVRPGLPCPLGKLQGCSPQASAMIKHFNETAGDANDAHAHRR